MAIVQQSTPYIDPENHNAHHHRQLDRQTDRQTDNSMMPIADHTVNHTIISNNLV